MITLNELNNMLKVERKTGELIPLPEDFYSQTKNTLDTANKSDNNEYNNISKVVSSIKEKRMQKLLIYIAYNKQIPAPLPSEEEDLYIQIKKIVNISVPETKSIKVKVVKGIPQVITPSGNSIGPLEQNEIIYLSDSADVKFIVDNKIGEIVN